MTPSGEPHRAPALAWAKRDAPAKPADGAVVIVDDEEDIRAVLAELIELRGYRVKTARDGVELLALMRGNDPISFVLLDLAMPVMGGLEVLATMDREPALQRIPVWVSTATPTLVPPGVPCLPKPLSTERLYEVLSRFSKRAG